MEVKPQNPDFLTRRQQERQSYRAPQTQSTNTPQRASAPAQAKTASEASAAVPADKAKSSATSQAYKVDLSSPQKKPAEAESKPMKERLGSFYASSPNGDKLAEMRAKSDEIIKKYQNPTT